MMNRLHILIILAVFTLMFGCNEAEHADGIDSEKWNKNAYNLAGQLLDADTSLLNVMGILPVGDYLFLKQKTRKHEYSIYQRKGDSLVFVEHFLRKGNGPSEVNSVRLYNFPEFESLVAVAFNTYGKIMIIPYGKNTNMFAENNWRISNNNALRSSCSVIPIDTTNYMTRRIIDVNNNVFATYKIGDTDLRDIPYTYPASSARLPPAERSTYIYQFHLVKRPGKNQYVSSTSFGHFTQVFEMSGNRISNVKTIFGELPEYTLVDGKVNISNSTKLGLNIYTSKNYIFIKNQKITTGTREQDIKRNGMWPGYSNEIYVCDWFGNPITKYVLDHPICYCAVDDAEQYMYAVTYDENTLEQAIVRYKLSF